jgi:hypothetical protein
MTGDDKVYVPVSYYKVNANGECEDYNAAYEPKYASGAIQAYNGFSKGDCVSHGFGVMVHPTLYKK